MSVAFAWTITLFFFYIYINGIIKKKIYRQNIENSMLKNSKQNHKFNRFLSYVDRRQGS